MAYDSLGENCGIAAVSSQKKSDIKENVAYILYRLLLSMQNRGQLSAGITTYNANRRQLIDTYKDLGLVNEVFRTNNYIKSMDILTRYSGTKGIGHVRYATCGSDDKSLAQPFERHHGRLWKWFSICFNGNLANYNELKNKLLERKDYQLIYDSDTELMMHYIAREIKSSEKPDLAFVFANLSEKFDGAYNIAYIDATGELAAVRDPLGIKPLSYGIKDDKVIVASETNAIINCNIHEFKTVNPGELVLIKDGHVEVKKYVDSPRKAHCMFEWVYFSNVSSSIEGKSVYLVRRRLGEELAKQETLKIDEDTIVVPVPETSKIICDAMAFALGTTTHDGLIRNRFVGRSFIESKNREDIIKNKFTVLKEVIQDKKVILVDDSIVRSTTSKALVKYLKDVGKAKEVHMRVACPPIVAPCFYGIDMSTLEELLVLKFFDGDVDEVLPDEILEKMAEYIGADSLSYISHSGLIRSIDLPKKDLCMACLNKDYPTSCGKKLFLDAVKNFKNGKVGRTYE